MKTILMIALALVSVNAVAANKDSSWKEIYDAGLSAQWPQVNFDGTFVSIDNVCVDGEMMKTVAPVTVCTDWRNNGESSECAAWGEVSLATARSFTKTIPGGDGMPDVSYDFSYALSYEIPVGIEAGEGGFQQLFTKAHAIANCR